MKTQEHLHYIIAIVVRYWYDYWDTIYL